MLILVVTTYGEDPRVKMPESLMDLFETAIGITARGHDTNMFEMLRRIATTMQLAEAHVFDLETVKSALQEHPALLELWHSLHDKSDSPLFECIGNAKFQFRHLSFQHCLFCSAIIDRQADQFWESNEIAIQHVENPELQNVFKIGGARLNGALAQIRDSWDFHGYELSVMGKRTIVSLLNGATALRELDLSCMGLEGAWRAKDCSRAPSLASLIVSHPNLHMVRRRSAASARGVHEPEVAGFVVEQARRRLTIAHRRPQSEKL